MKYIAPLLLLLPLTGCFSTFSSYHQSYATAVEQTHAAATWHDEDVFVTDLKLVFGGKTALDGKMFYETSSGRARIETADGGVMVWDGKNAWVAPTEADGVKARFAILTWPYFLAVPYKLQDPGTKIVAEGTGLLKGRELATDRLTFADGTGDTPDDFYVIYTDESDRVEAVRYIVTYGKDADPSELKQSLMTYEDYATVAGVPIATTWQFYYWDPASENVGKQKATGKLSKMAFIAADEGLFERPANSKPAEMPTAK